MILPYFLVSVSEEVTDYFGVCLDELDDEGIAGGFLDANSVCSSLHLHLDLVRVTEDLPKQRVAHVDRTTLLDTFVHRLGVLLDLGRNFFIRGFGQGFDSVRQVLHFAGDLFAMVQEVVKYLHVCFLIRGTRTSTLETWAFSLFFALGGEF